LESVAHINPKPFLGRFIYEPDWIIPSSVTEDNVGGRFEVRIAQRFLNRDNDGFERRKLWGTGIYTDDSDIVASTFHFLLF
jgi:Histone deacetylation protein Rxt3